MDYKFEDFLLDFKYKIMEECGNADILSQQEVYHLLNADWEYADGFPMISYEETPDSDFHANLQTSNFLHGLSYGWNCKWVCMSNWSDVVGLLCLSCSYETLKIEAFEINMMFRRFGYSRKILEILESVAETNDYERIEVSAYDSQAESYWEHMGYIRTECKGGTKYVKSL